MKPPAPNVDLRSDHWAIVRSALQRHVPDREVLAFGSRATWTAKEYSDLDLAVMGEKPLSLRTASALDEALGDSDLPFKVDVVDWARIDEEFRRIIRRHGLVVQESGRGSKGPSSRRMRQTVYGRVASDHSEEPLSDLCVPRCGIQTGPFGSQLHKRDYVATGTPIVTVEHLGNNRLIHKDLPRVSDRDRERLSRYRMESGDIVFSRVGSVDRRALVRQEEEGWLFSGRCLRVRVDSAKINPVFLSYFFGTSGFRQYINSIAVGATMPSLNTQLLSDVVIPHPPLPEQRSIAHILGTLDDKIELNRRMNETLETMARALFKSWFVDFDPVRAKWEGRDTGLPKDIADLFPNRLVDSKIGEIPDRWEVARLRELMEVNPKRRLRRGQIAPYLPMKQMPTQGHVPDYVSVRPFGSGMRFANGDTLIARITPCLENGKAAYVDFLGDDEVGWGSTEYIVLKPRPPLPDQFAYCLARSATLREFAIQNMSGTSGRQRVPATAMKGFLMVAPPVRLVRQFGEVAGLLFERASAAGRESRTLAALRDTLLPRLISGEMRLEEAARIIGTTV